MIRMQIQLDPATRDALRRRAFEEGKSVSAVAREVLQKALLPPPAPGTRYDFSSIAGIIKGDFEAVAENHDDYLFGEEEP